MRVGVDRGDGGAGGGAVGVVAFGREEERALPLPVGGGDEAGDDGGAGGGGAAVGRVGWWLVELRAEWGRARGGDALLPVGEGLVAEEPLPLPVDGVADGEVGEEGAAGVVGVEAGDVRRRGPVAVVGAVW